MDMGATLCTRSKPKCTQCPVQDDCAAYQTDRVHELPTPRPRKAVPERHATFLLLMHGNDIMLEKRPGSGIWGGLWCLPQFEDEQAAMAWCAQQGMNAALESVGAAISTSSGQALAANNLRQQAGSYDGQCEALTPFTHTFTHFKLHIAPVLLHVNHKPHQVQQAGSVWLDVEDALQAAIPTPVRTLLEKVNRV
jgi:A/G-specific adenine glycosylase